MTVKSPYTAFGKRMKIAMLEQNITQQELAERLGLAKSTISDVIHGRNFCRRTRERIKETLGMEEEKS